ncbi:hypothetical protein AB0J74_33835 [Asanoa sp. NPDC049573]|uniref:hypothetical protein n=1 Tax=Asanoa sp. NPDC049573 TaxID=3155396 RepID=UPI00342C8223
MVERVQVRYATTGQRGLAWLAAGYCTVVALVLAAGFPALILFTWVFILLAAIPAVIRPLVAFRVAVVASIVLSLLFSVLFYFTAFVQFAAAIPLALAPTRLAARDPVGMAAVSAALLTAPLGMLVTSIW